MAGASAAGSSAASSAVAGSSAAGAVSAFETHFIIVCAGDVDAVLVLGYKGPYFYCLSLEVKSAITNVDDVAVQLVCADVALNLCKL